MPTVSTKEILTNNNPAICLISKNVNGGDELVKAILIKELQSLNEFFNVPQMSVSQRIETVKLACETFNYWKLDDFKMCFKNIKTGKYGKLFNRIDGGVIFDCFRAYDKERGLESESINKAEQPTKANPEGQKRVIEILSEFVEKTNPLTKKVVRQKTEADIVAQKAFVQFDKIHKKLRDNGGKRFIKRYGKMMDQAEFLDYKLNQYIRVKELLKKSGKLPI